MSNLLKATAVWGTPGGKRLLAKRLVSMLPEHRVYTEPFAGSGAVFFAKERAEVEVLNDIDSEVMAAYRAIKSLTKDELKSLAAKSWTGSRATWDSLRQSSPGSKVERLHKFLYVTFYSSGKRRGKSFDAGLVGYSTKNIIKRVIAAHDRLKGVHLQSRDYAATVKEYDAKDALHFLDPPYPGYRSDHGDANMFDEDEFHALLKSIKGKFLAITSARGRKDWGGFNVRKISHMSSAKDGNKTNPALDDLIVTNFDVAQKSLGGGFWFLDLSKAFPGGDPEAGLHSHSLHREAKKTAKDGAHKHAFQRSDGTIIWTDEDGEHEHEIEEWENLGGGAHAHQVTLEGMGEDGEDLVLFTSGDGSFHGHQLQSSRTAFDGVHSHTLQIGSELLRSLSGKDLWELEGKPDQAQNPPSPPASALAALAMNKAGPGQHLADPFVIGQIDVGADGNIYVDSDNPSVTVMAALAKRMPHADAAATRVLSGPPPLDHVTVAEVLIRPTESRAIKQMNLDMDSRIGHSDDLFSVWDVTGTEIGRFDSRLLAEQVVGEVAAMRGDEGVPSVLSWSSVESAAMPPPGMSMLPPSLERQVPEHLRYWKMAGERARSARDALVDSGFADAIRNLDGRMVAVRSTISVAKASDLDDMPARPETMEEVIGALAGMGCGVWESGEPPDKDIEHDGHVFVPDWVAAAWAANGTLQDALASFAKHSAGALIACPDSVAARCAMSSAGSLLQIRKSACANLVFHATTRGLAKASFVHPLEDVPMNIAFEAETEFVLGKSAGGTYLVVGESAFLLSKSLDSDSGASFAAMVDAPKDLDVLDQGSAISKDDGVFRMFNLRGKVLSGEFSARPSGSMWRVMKDAAPIEDIRVHSLHKVDRQDEQFILGIVMEPETFDAHADITSVAEIRAAAHDYMIRSRRVKLQHGQYTDRVVVVQSYTAPHKLNIGGQRVKADTWLMGMLIFDSGLWKRFLAGEYTGLSIGGSGFRDPRV